MAVVELRRECDLAGISNDGLKVDLVERLLQWAVQAVTARTQGTHTTTTSTTSSSEEASNHPSSQSSRSSMVSSSSSSFSSRNKLPHSPSSSSSSPQSSFHTTPDDIKVQWLGTSSGAPTSRRNVSCIAVRYGEDRVFLVDSGEGTRNQMRIANIDPALVTHIFITHLHGDHCFGIAGTLAAISSARVNTPRANEPIELYGPPELHRLMIASCRSAGVQLANPVIVRSWVFDPAKEAAPTPVDPGKKLMLGFQGPDQGGVVPPEVSRTWQVAYDSGSDQVVRRGLTWTRHLPGGVTVTAAQLQHRMPCWGYVFEEPAVPVEDPEVIAAAKQRLAGTREFHSQQQDYNNNNYNGGASAASFSEGEESGTEEDSSTTSSSSSRNDNNRKWVRPGRKLVLLGDTCDSSAIAELARGCDILSHEATFQKGMEEKAKLATHSTSEQAGNFARVVRAKNLVLTHFSGRYENGDKYKNVWLEARSQGKSMKEMHFSNVMPLAEEAKAAAGWSKVYLANDFYAFKVQPSDPIPQDVYLNAKKRLQKKHVELATAQAAGRIEFEGERGWQQREQSGGNGGGRGGGRGGGYQPEQRDRQYTGGRQQQQQQRSYNSGGGGGQRRGSY